MFYDLEKMRLDVEKADAFIRARGLNSSAFCVVPFTNIILEPDGSVGVCRQKGNHFSVGNIKDNSIVEIWNNQKMRNWRREFLHGQPSTCKVDIKHEQCNRCPSNNQLLPFVEFDEIQHGKILKLTANFNGRCNLRCRMCDIWQLPNGFYDEINFWGPAKEEIFPFLREIDMLSGEPLIQADTYRLINEVVKVNPDCEWTITSNIHWAFNHKIESYLSKIKLKTLIVSIDSLVPEVYALIRPQGNLSRVLKTLDDLLMYRDTVKPFNIRLNFLVQKDNWMEVFNAIDFCYEKSINPFLTFLYDPLKFSLLSEEPDTRKEILDHYFLRMNKRQAVHLKRVLMPLIDSLTKIERANYLLTLQQFMTEI